MFGIASVAKSPVTSGPAGAISSGLDLLKDPAAQDMRDDAIALIDARAAKGPAKKKGRKAPAKKKAAPKKAAPKKKVAAKKSAS